MSGSVSISWNLHWHADNQVQYSPLWSDAKYWFMCLFTQASGGEMSERKKKKLVRIALMGLCSFAKISFQDLSSHSNYMNYSIKIKINCK